MNSAVLLNSTFLSCSGAGILSPSWASARSRLRTDSRRWAQAWSWRPLSDTRRGPPRQPPGPAAEPAPGQSLRVYSDLHAFYYSWYGSPGREGHYIHWDHVMVPHWDPKISASYPRGRHSPPDDLGSSFYPELGPYSSRDPDVLREHMTQLKEAAIGELPPPPSLGPPASPFFVPTPQLPLLLSPGLWSPSLSLASYPFSSRTLIPCSPRGTAPIS